MKNIILKIIVIAIVITGILTIPQNKVEAKGDYTVSGIAGMMTPKYVNPDKYSGIQTVIGRILGFLQVASALTTVVVVAFLGFKMLISLGIIAIMLLLYRVPVGINILFVFPVLTVFFVFCFGCSLIVMHFGVYVNDLSNALNILLSFVYLLTGIFYNVQTSFPQPFGYLLQRMNPVAHMLFCMRKAILYNETPSCVMLLVWLVLSVTLSYIGLKLIYKNENDYVKII